VLANAYLFRFGKFDNQTGGIVWEGEKINAFLGVKIMTQTTLETTTTVNNDLK
jgi:hypothetical protein